MFIAPRMKARRPREREERGTTRVAGGRVCPGLVTSMSTAPNMPHGVLLSIPTTLQGSSSCTAAAACCWNTVSTWQPSSLCLPAPPQPLRLQPTKPHLGGPRPRPRSCSPSPGVPATAAAVYRKLLLVLLASQLDQGRHGVR